MAMAMNFIDDPVLFDTRTVRIRNIGSRMFLSKGDPSKDGVFHVVQRGRMLDQNGAVQTSQVWHVFSVDQNRFLVVNKRCGNVLNVEGNSKSPGKFVHLYPLQGNRKSSQTWVFHMYEDFSYVINCRSDLRLTVDAFSTESKAKVRQLRPEPPAGEDGQEAKHESQMWEIIEHNVFEDVLQVSQQGLYSVDNFGPTNPMTIENCPPASPTAAITVGRVLVPFLFVKDNTREDPLKQLEESHIYILTRNAYWNMIYFYNHPGGYEINDDFSDIKLGLITDNAQEIDDVIGITVDPNGEIRIKDSATKEYFGSTLGGGLRIVVVDALRPAGETSLKCELNHLADKEQAVAMWVIEDRYELADRTGATILEWTVRRQKSDTPRIPTIETSDWNNIDKN